MHAHLTGSCARDAVSREPGLHRQSSSAGSSKVMGFKRRMASQLLASGLTYTTLVWLLALVVGLAIKSPLNSPIVVFGLSHLISLSALLSLRYALARHEYAFLLFLCLNLAFLIAIVILVSLLVSNTMGEDARDAFAAAPLMQVFLFWEMVAAVAMEVLVEVEVRHLVRPVLLKISRSSTTLLLRPKSDKQVLGKKEEQVQRMSPVKPTPLLVTKAPLKRPSVAPPLPPPLPVPPSAPAKSLPPLPQPPLPAIPPPAPTQAKPGVSLPPSSAGKTPPSEQDSIQEMKSDPIYDDIDELFPDKK